MESSIRIEEIAADWLAKRDTGNWSENDERELSNWLDESTAHAVAFIRLEAAWKHTRRLKALGAGAHVGTIPTPDELRASPFFERHAAAIATAGSPSAPREQPRNRRLQVRALAASLVLATIAAGVTAYLWPSRNSYTTPVGGIAAVPLSDGSKVTLNTNSEIHVVVTDSERRIELKQGEAFFEVAIDPRRPFVVTAGDKRVIAVGTKFAVRRERNDVRVVVTEGRVKIERIGSQAPEPQEALFAGSVARTRDVGVLVEKKALAEAEEILSWRSGYIVFRDIPLADAVAEFNRYNTRKIIVEDSGVGAIKLSGTFRSTNFEAFVRLLEDGFPIDAEQHTDEIVLKSR